ncbi:uncharacterized protein LOC114536600 [Dendronephthya gigantea]|uniref:uncharacterized protein LOC114536600 n=1 Tax=Dendronephthya gigantea TaxID=151771 RepID=UPI00106DA600|nr:uncharacterized protein LOC114536600 [Dendronephthya gigantea]
MTSFYSSTILHIIGSVLCGVLMVAAICAIGLQSSVWYIALDLANIVNSAQCTDAYNAVGSNPRCNCYRQLHYSDTDDLDDDETLLSLMSCSETKHFPAIVSAMAILSAIAYLVCQATCFVYAAKLWGSLNTAKDDENIFHETTSQQVLLNEHPI